MSDFAKDANVPTNDCISRQAAIGRAVEIPLFGKLVKVVAVSELEALSSAQPSDDYERGWEDGRKALREEMWEDERDRLD